MGIIVATAKAVVKLTEVLVSQADPISVRGPAPAETEVGQSLNA
jgi:hypothetical protein